MDSTTESAMKDLALPHVTTLALTEVETPELMAVKESRSIAEYCWTLTPFSVDFVFNQDPTIERATYIDADVWFAQNPQLLFTEMETAGAQALITPHAYSPEHSANIRFGIYCVQFMPFTRAGSRAIREDWQSKCLDWCFAVDEPHRFGDQKYLDQWPTDFGSSVQVLQCVEKTQAPWNAVSFDPSDAVMYHFHRLRLASTSKAFVGTYRLPRRTVTELYRPYLADIAAANKQLASIGVPFKPQIQPLQGWPLVKDFIDFHRHNWRSPFAPYSIDY